MSVTPVRPRLARHVLARLHRSEGRELVVLIDQASARTYQIGMREWVLLSSADGTRDRDGILLAAAREGAVAKPEALDEFFAKLAEANMLDDGPEEAPTPRTEDHSARTRPIDALPGYRFSCDARGICCHQYATIVFSPLEAARARVLLPAVERGGDRQEYVFTPQHGTGPSAGCAVKHVEGACAYLGDDGLCRIHAAGGSKAKPFGCSLFPSRFVDDGAAVRVSCLLECACVLRSAESDLGDPLVAEGVSTRDALPAEVLVEVLPDPVALSRSHELARADFVAWTRLVARDAAPDDLAAWCWSVADHIDTTGHLPSPDVPMEFDPSCTLPWLRALRASADHVAANARAWRSRHDLAQEALDALREVLTVLVDDPSMLAAVLDVGVRRPDEERFVLRATAHGHQWALRGPFSLELRNLALRILGARAIDCFRALGALPMRAFEVPFATVEALCRAYGIRADAPHGVAS